MRKRVKMQENAQNRCGIPYCRESAEAIGNADANSRRNKRRLTRKERKAYTLTESTADYVAYALGRGEDEGMWRGAAAYQTINAKDGEMGEVKTKYLVNASSNKLEIRAIMSAVNAVPERKKVIVYTHNVYAAHVLMGEWQAKHNLELIENYKAIAEKRCVLVLWRPYYETPIFNVLDESIRNLPELEGVKLTKRLKDLKNKPVISKA